MEQFQILYWVLIISVIIVNSILGIIVYLKDKNNHVNISFAGMILFMNIWILSSFGVDSITNYEIALSIVKITFFSASFFAWLLLYFVSIFQEDIKRSSSARNVLFFVPALIVAIISMTEGIVKDIVFMDWGIDVVFGPLIGVFMVYFVSYVIASLAILLTKMIRHKGIERLQTTYILIGLSITLLLTSMTNLIIPVLFNYDYFARFGHFFSVVYVVFTYYAIIKHRLLGIRVILRQSLVYFVMTVMISAGYLALMFLFQGMFKNMTGINILWPTVLFGFLISVFLLPLKDMIQNIINKAFFRTKYDNRSVLQGFSDSMANCENEEDFSEQIVSAIGSAFKPKGAACFLTNKELGIFVCSDAQGSMIDMIGKTFPAVNVLITEMAARNKTVRIADYINEHQDQEEILGQVIWMNAGLLIPVSSVKKKNMIWGFLAVDKESEYLFSPEDLIFVEFLLKKTGIEMDKTFLKNNC